jgi:hypothetical protein
MCRYGQGLVGSATGAVTVDKTCNARRWTDRKGEEAIRDDREQTGDPEQVAHEWELENEVIWNKPSLTQAIFCASYAAAFRIA